MNGKQYGLFDACTNYLPKQIKTGLAYPSTDSTVDKGYYYHGNTIVYSNIVIDSDTIILARFNSPISSGSWSFSISTARNTDRFIIYLTGDLANTSKEIGYMIIHF